MSKNTASSRSPESRRERRIIRNYLRVAIAYNALQSTDDVLVRERVNIEMDNAEALLRSLPGYDHA